MHACGSSDSGRICLTPMCRDSTGPPILHPLKTAESTTSGRRPEAETPSSAQGIFCNSAWVHESSRLASRARMVLTRSAETGAAEWPHSRRM